MTTHILNGDALKEQFPSEISGGRIVARLCLVDGPTVGETTNELFTNRAAFISGAFPEYSEADYFNTSVLEIRKIENLPENSTINLWFEDDLFCQVNLWFILDFIARNNKGFNLNLVRPKAESAYSFGWMTPKELMQSFENKTPIKPTDLNILSQFWKLYQKNNITQLASLAEGIKDKFPFLIPAIYAHRDRLPMDGKPGRPKATIIRIMQALNTEEFGPIFQAFCEKEPIYGFGDFQVKRLFNEIINERKKDSGDLKLDQT